MVIRYERYGRRRVPLRGAFVASSKSNELLRQRITEPSSHDCWTKNASADVPQDATATARSVLDKIKGSVIKMATEIAPTPPKTNRALGTFSKLMTGFIGNKHRSEATSHRRPTD